YFFFQAEDGIRDRNVTGVQTCALPISVGLKRAEIIGDKSYCNVEILGLAYNLVLNIFPVPILVTEIEKLTVLFVTGKSITIGLFTKYSFLSSILYFYYI